MPDRSDSPPVEDDGVTTLQEEILILLEAAEIPTAVNDFIIALVAMGEQLREWHYELRAGGNSD